MAALSLTCKQCNTSLKSIKEAQEHGEVTGHSQFEESTEPVRCTQRPIRRQGSCRHLITGQLAGLKSPVHGM